MNILIEAPFQVSELDRKMIESKIEDLKLYNESITEASVFFNLDDGGGDSHVLSEIRLRIPGKDLFAKEADQISQDAFVKAWNQIKRQLLRRKEKEQAHR